MSMQNSQRVDTNTLTDEKFDALTAELIKVKFNHAPDANLERKPKADKGV